MSTSSEESYGPESPDYGLSYEPDPWADPEPVNDPDGWEADFRENDPNDDTTEAGWEEAFRQGLITRDQFARRRDRGETQEVTETAPAAETDALASAVAKLRAGLADPDLSADRRAEDERALASLERVLAMRTE
ncbi:hypothetical protein ACH4VQ_36395 [Streptomyces anulatus]